MMNDTAGFDDEGHPVSCHERKARILDRDLRGRTSSGPAEMVPRQKAGDMTASRRNVQNVRKTTCQSGPSTYDRIDSARQTRRQEMNGRLRFPAAVTECSNSDFYTGRTRPSLSRATPMDVPPRTASPWGWNSPKAAAFIGR